MKIIRKIMAVVLIAALCIGGSAAAEVDSDLKLDKVVILSRHNIRSPLSGSGSLLGDITPHEWFGWTSNPSELSLRGAMLETIMGQYFRLWRRPGLKATRNMTLWIRPLPPRSIL